MELRIVRHTNNFDAACAFYNDLLGWPITREWSHGGRGRIFGYGDSARIELLETAVSSPASPEPRRGDVVHGLTLAIEEPDVRALHDSLVAAGITITQPMADQPWGHRNFGVADPAGIALVFFQWI